MIAISDDFKEAIKEKNREIKGYAEVTYLHGNIDGEVNSDGIGTDIAVICEDNNEILTGNRVVTNYASLEQDYFKLDGSFILPNEPAGFENENTGYISDDIESQYLNKKIKISSSTSNAIIYDNLSALTVYFKDNIPSTINLKIYYINHNPIIQTINNNIDDVVYFEFDEISYITSIEITLNGFMYNNRRIRIPKIEAGLTNVYKDSDLISFTVTEQISEFNEEIPIDECDLIVDNYDNKFDIMNPQGLTKYLSNDVQIEPFIGIITENNGIEYVSMGIYYLQNYTNNEDKTTTFHCEKNFSKLSKQNGYFRTTYEQREYTETARKYFEKLCYEYDIKEYNFNAITSNDVVDDMCLPMTTKLQQLSNFAMFTNTVLKNGRNDNIIIENIGNTINDTLTLNEMKSIPKYDAKNVLKSISIKKHSFDFKPIENIEIFNDTIYVSKEHPFVMEYNNPGNILDVSDFESEDYKDFGIVNSIFFYSTNRYEGNVNIHLWSVSESEIKKELFINQYNNDGTEIEIDNGYYFIGIRQYGSLLVEEAIQNTADYIKNNYKKYNVKIDYFGNPAYEPNDILKIETPYGYKTMRILKHSLTFNGGLSGSIEGVGD